MSALTARLLVARTHLTGAEQMLDEQMLAREGHDDAEVVRAIVGTLHHTINALDAITARLEQHIVGGAADHPELDPARVTRLGRM